MNKKVTGGVIIGVLAISTFVGFYFIPGLLPSGGPNPGILIFFPRPSPPQKWALIICSSHTFHESDITGGFTANPNFDSPGPDPPWETKVFNGTGGPNFYWEPNEGRNDTASDPGCINITTNEAYQHGQWEVKVPDFLLEADFGYSLEVWVMNNTPDNNKIYIGFNWTSVFDDPNPPEWNWDGFEEVNTGGVWKKYILTSQCPPYATLAGGGCKLVFGYDQQSSTAGGLVRFDTVRLNFSINITDPGGTPNQTAADGFPAQAIQAYWALRNHSWDPNNIFLMINAGDTDVKVHTTIINDYIYTQPYIDVLGNDVNKSRFKRELNASISGSWASNIKSNDEVLIYMIDHGATVFDPTFNATFHFDTGRFVTENETDNLLNTINCKQLILMADMCFAGNFIQPFLNSSSNRILIAAAAAPKVAWYWVSVTNFHYAGSFFFHTFWQTLNTTSNTLMNAFTAGINHVPFNHPVPVAAIQAPVYIDNIGIFNSWTL